jgi:chromosomal replication initiator protein
MQSVWNEVQAILRVEMSPQSYEIWLRDVRMSSLHETSVEIEVPNRFHGDWIVENYLDILKKAFSEVTGRNLTIRMVLGSNPANMQRPQERTDLSAASDARGDALGDPNDAGDSEDWSGGSSAWLSSSSGQPHPDKSFANFVVGRCNEFAHAASLSVSDFPGRQNNPLFIYSDSGLGKTHLLHAIGNRILEQDRNASVLYVTAEEFMNEMISALRYKKMSEFRERYRSRIEILLMDDIQFLGGKDRTQEEFFHTFQALQGSGRQIVMTADVLPKAIKGIEDRLRTRFEGGLIADIQAPDMETLLAILAMKADALHLDISSEAQNYIASHVQGNIRELEGALNRLAATSAFYKEPLTLEIVSHRLDNVLKNDKPAISGEQIIQAVARFYNLKASDIRGASRLKRLVRPRHIAIYLIREHTDNSFPDIGRLVGNRDHATIQYGYRKIKDELGTDPNLASFVEMIEKNLGF